MTPAEQLETVADGSGDPWIDRVVGEKYLLRERLGSGTGGRVYLATDQDSSAQRAVKILEADPSAGEDHSAALWFEHRAALVSALEHPSIARILDYGNIGREARFVTMEFLEGETLEAVNASDEPLEVRSQLRILIQLAGAIQAAHEQGLVHRDLKPSNVMLVPGQEEGASRVKLLDFGISETSGAELGMSTFLGSPSYMAPGQAQGDPPDPRDDVYALGVIAYELACGRLPFEADSTIGVMLLHRDEQPKPPRMIDGEVPLKLEEAILRALAKRREDRFQTMEEWIAALEEVWLGLEGQASSPIGPARRTRLPLWIAGGLSALVGILIAIGATAR